MFQKIILIGLDWRRPKDPFQSLGHASILANLKKYKIPVIQNSWAVNSLGFNIDDVVQFIVEHAKEQVFIAFGAFVWNEFSLRKILAEIKSRKIPGKIIIGGPQISYLLTSIEDIEDGGVARRNVLESLYPEADIFIRGYAENALVELMLFSNLQKEIPGIHYRDTIDNNSLAAVVLRDLPSPFLQGLVQSETFIRWETKRGCPFRCAFCQHKAPNASQYYEYPIDRIKKEAEWIMRKGINDVAIVDPTFNIENTHYLDVLQILIDLGYCGKLALQCRIEFVTDVFLEKVVELNKKAQVVLEFGLQTINKQEEKAIQRTNKLAKVSYILRLCVGRDIKIEVSLIYGLPLQTVNSFVSSVQFLVDLGVPIIRAWPLMLLRGTKLYETKNRYNLKESDEIIPHVISSSSFPITEYKKMQLISDSLQIYNQLSKDEQLTWDVAQQKPSQATMCYLSSISFFRQHRNLIADDYIIQMRHNDAALQQIYDERFGLISKG